MEVKLRIRAILSGEQLTEAAVKIGSVEYDRLMLEDFRKMVGSRREEVYSKLEKMVEAEFSLINSLIMSRAHECIIVELVLGGRQFWCIKQL